jgi:hypothetical protein
VSAPPTAEEAKRFVEQVDKDRRRLWVARDRAGWVNQNFITDDTEALSAAGEEATAAYVTEAITKARRFERRSRAFSCDPHAPSDTGPGRYGRLRSAAARRRGPGAPGRSSASSFYSS